ncbi:MAG: biotin--[acetyl-CoA-carboxylase] ligase, partial [Chloroflexota bacterium]|nr:biotin--[acetyl-CoA-carboxylase] ligase [Chloroflexota bacterium]
VGEGALAPTIKWSNDVLLNGRKVAGILSESEFTGGEWAFSVLGFGINVNLQREQLAELRNTATSLSTELGREVDRVEVLARVLGELESLYLLLQGGQFSTVHAEWVAALETLGKRVSIADPANKGAGGLVQGKAVRVDADGALVVLTDAGIERRVLAGDVLPS